MTPFRRDRKECISNSIGSQFLFPVFRMEEQQGEDKNSRGIRLEGKRNDEEQTAGNEDVEHEVLPALLLVLLAGLHAEEVTRGRLVRRLMVVGITAQAARRGREGSKGDGGGGRGEGAGPHVPGGSYRRVGSEKHHCFVCSIRGRRRDWSGFVGDPPIGIGLFVWGGLGFSLGFLMKVS